MTFQLQRAPWWWAAALCCTITACNTSTQKPQQATDPAAAPGTTAPANQPVPIDTLLDNIAAFVSGVEQTPNSPYKALEQKDYWIKEKQFFDENWSKMERERLVPMAKWRDAELVPHRNESLTMFYPFSGPDFLHAYHLFPNATNYVFLALEPVGEVPAISSYNDKQLNDYIGYINNALRDIYKRSYFITLHMGGDLLPGRAKGTIPIFMVFLKRTNHELISCEKIAMNRQGEILAYNDKNKGILDTLEAQGVRFKFKAKGTNIVKTLTYWSMDISDENTAKHPYFIKYLRTLGPTNTFVKSASYLMHYGTFGDIRNTTLDISETILQDDTGIAFRFFDRTKWNFQLYGEYTSPIADFKGMKMQADLRTAYDTSKTRRDMPFSLGYHWKDAKQNYLFATKRK